MYLKPIGMNPKDNNWLESLKLSQIMKQSVKEIIGFILEFILAGVLLYFILK